MIYSVPISAAILSGLLFLFPGCIPDEEGQPIPLPTRICVTTKHHDRPIADMNIYFKYLCDTFPGYYQPASYYDTLVVSDKNGYACVGPVPIGKHWIIALGADEHAQQLLPVFGRLPVLVDLNQRIKIDTIVYLYE